MNDTRPQPPEMLDACQVEASERALENELPSIFVLLYRLRWHIRTNGYLPTAKRIVVRLMSNLRPGRKSKIAAPKTMPIPLPLGLRPGEIVEVLSEQEIRQTLDANGKDRGLPFMPEMLAFCGKRLKVLKPVKNIMVDEFGATARLRPVKNVVLLQEAICHGAGIECDRSCFFFWKESWLKRVDHEHRSDEPGSVHEIPHEEHEDRKVDIGTFPF